ncbi:hypothetical protein JD844_006496 [Phrynosoma platyrhinos]|uniref:Uncharacterized protein n=1 Tax=Phrynosoma platyrhinos TaxID=52577 RepID=A0ABQ7T272_PHRPL|nr:hypothetical protein JD844_006496 [Phrynosoma platyrhinos]
MSEVIQYQGYPNEEYEVLTDNGYYLPINRIPYGSTNSGNSDCYGRVISNTNASLFLLFCYSFHEMGMNDLPAIINFILAKTGQEKIFYIGHSQGSTIAFIAFSAIPQLAQKIKVFFAFGPVAFLNHSKSPYPKLAFLADNVGKVKKSGVFKAFDYGSENVKKYHQGTPPAYNIQGMDVPIAVWSGGSDIMATPKDTEQLLPLLRNLIYYKEIPHWMHYDFIFGLDAHQEVYDELIEIVQNFP